ncbi:MAG: DedA family protein [Rhodospirillaceae bacterium]|nr:DedA family protein [Rhodospirillaceae bacterium]
MLRRLYNATMAQATTPHAMWTLAIVAFVESSIFPIPPDILIIPMVLAARAKAWRIAVMCTIASVLGGFAGYAIGLFLFDQVAQPILAFYGYLQKFETFQALYNQWGAWIVFGAGITPFPYKVITIASGMTGLNVFIFAIASVLSRGLRFFLVAGLLWRFGEPIRATIETHLGKLATAFFVLLIGGFIALKYLAT